VEFRATPARLSSRGKRQAQLTDRNLPASFMISSGKNHRCDDGETLKPDKPRLFIGSSLEGAEIAEAVRECKVWTDGISNLSGFTLNDLIKISKTKDSAKIQIPSD
jgi:hypothetical protein